MFNFAGNLSFRNKIMVSILSVIIFLAVTTLILVRGFFLHILKDTSREKGVAIARSIAAHSAIGVLTRNSVRLKELIEKEKGLDKSISYFFILDSKNEILAHTFEKGFPVELVNANSLARGNPYNIQLIDTGKELIDDIVVPVKVEGNVIGEIRAGISQNNIMGTVAAVNILFIGAAIVVAVLGMLLAYRISYLISQPITRLVKATRAVDNGNFDIEIDVDSKDEIGTLTRTFNEMVLHLKGQIEEIKRLTAVEERNRIAIELHDGLAQNLFQLITGLEYCEKIFQKDPRRAYNEIRELKENSRRLLQDARQVIFEVKRDEIQDGYVWLNQISDFINDFQKKKHIPVKFKSISIPKISLTKARVCFYIIKEAFNNIERHSHAKNIEFILSSNPGRMLNISIKDDGKGFDVDKILNTSFVSGKFGLVGMRQRVSTIGGELFIDSNPEKGTNIFISIPLEKGSSDG